jgi:hypothetical protein
MKRAEWQNPPEEMGVSHESRCVTPHHSPDDDPPCRCPNRSDDDRWALEPKPDAKIIVCKPMPYLGGYDAQNTDGTTRETQQVCARPNVRFYAFTPDGETLKHVIIPVNIQ